MSTEKQSKWEAYKQPVILIACVLVGADSFACVT